MHVQVRDFFEWRYHAREFYENLTMYVLPNHPISLNFTQRTVFSGDSLAFGLIMGIPEIEDQKSTVSLYNTLFPNRNSRSFDKSKPNKAWGRVNHMRMIPISGKLRAVAVSRSDDILAATDTSLIYITENGTSIAESNNSTQLIHFSPVPYSSDALLCSDTGAVSLFTPSRGITQITEFKRPVIDLTIDPYRPNSVLVAQGKTHIHNIDIRDDKKVEIKMPGHTSSLAFAPEMPFMFAAGQLSGSVGIFDTRMTNSAIVTIQSHDSEVTSLKWSPHNRDIVASASLDSVIALWSIRDVETSENTVFAHNGHVSPIVAFDWCKDIPWTLASVSEDNLFELWTIAPSQLEDYIFNA